MLALIRSLIRSFAQVIECAGTHSALIRPAYGIGKQAGCPSTGRRLEGRLAGKNGRPTFARWLLLVGEGGDAGQV